MKSLSKAARCQWLAAAALFTMLLFGYVGAQAQTIFTVINTNATGAGTFTDALTQINNTCPAGVKRIVFTIPAATDPGCNAITGVCTVNLGASGRNINCPDVEIDGYSQPGSSVNTATGGTFNGQIKIEFAGGGAFGVAHDRATIRGIAFASTQLNLGLRFVFGTGLVGVGGHIIAGNFFGWRADGLSPVTGSTVTFGSIAGGANANGIRIGGNLPADVNLITAASTVVSAVEFGGGTNNLLEGNVFNLDRNRQITPGAISAHGVLFSFDGGQSPPAQNTVRRNVIAKLQNSGINCNGGAGLRFTENAIFDARLGGSLTEFGIRLAVGCNNNQAAPVIGTVTYGGSAVTVQGTLNSAPNESFVIEFFHNAIPDTANVGRGEQFVGNTTVTTNGAGSAAFTVNLPAFTRNVSSTASRISTNDTSKFSNAIISPPPPTISNGPPPNGTAGVAYSFTYTSTGSPTFSVTAGSLPPGLTLSSAGVLSGTPTSAGTFTGTVKATNGIAPDANQAFSITIAAAPPALTIFTVINTNATGAGTFTDALTQINNTCPAGVKRIVFTIPAATDPGCNAITGVCTVNLGASGRNINCPDVEIDGYSQPGSSVNTATGGTFNGQIKIEFAGGGSFTVGHDRATIRGIAFAGTQLNFGLRQVFGTGVVSVGGHVIGGNFFGWRADGLTPVTGSTITFTGTAGGAATTNNIRVGGSLPADMNLITAASSSVSAVEFSGGANNLLEGNVFNLDRDRQITPGAVSGHGVTFFSGPTQNTFRRNVIARLQGSGMNCETGSGLRFTENAIFDARLGGILSEFGIRLGVGCNNNQAAPVIGTVAYGGSAVTVQGTLNSAPNESFVIEFFHNATPDTANIGRGEQFVGSTTVTTNGAGSAAFTVNLPAFTRNVSSTASRISTNDTSMFSNAIISPPPPTITNGPPPNGTVGVAYSFTYTSTGSPTFSVTAGSLPPGLTLSSAGVLSGTPTSAGTFTGTVTASNGTAPNATQAFTITIAGAPLPPTITNGPPPDGGVGVVYAFTYNSSGAPTFSVISGSLPPGLALSPAGVLSGTPTTPGTFNGTVRATNGTPPDATQFFSITIALVVTNTNDSGALSLRAAILNANANCATPQTTSIKFNIPGAGPHVIRPLTQLPALTCTQLKVEGYSQPGAIQNTAGVSSNNAAIKVVIKGDLCAGACSGLVTQAHNITIQGLSIHSFANGAAVEVANPSSLATYLAGNYLGADPSGGALPNQYGARVTSGFLALGTGAAAAANYVANNTAGGIVVAAGTLASHANQIGGQRSGGAGNGNGAGGILFLGSGVTYSEVHDSYVRSNGGPGIGIANAAAFVAILRTPSFANSGPGIDLGINGPTVNDEAASPYDTDAGANRLQNHPVVTSVGYSGGNTIVSGYIKTSAPVGSCATSSACLTIELFHNSVAPATSEGEKLIDSFGVVLDASGFAAFTRTISGFIANNVSAVATYDSCDDGCDASSEFSPTVAVVGPSPAVMLSPASLTFAPQTVGSTSAAQSVTLTNTGTAALNISSISISGDFAYSTTCAASLAAGASCDFSVKFTPIIAGARAGQLKIVDDAPGSPHVVGLSGTGLGGGAPTVSLSSRSIAFADTTVGTQSATQLLTLANTGTASLHISALDLSSAEFAYTTDCGASLAPGAACAIFPQFRPTRLGTRVETLSIVTNASSSPDSVSLTGTGVALPVGTLAAAPAALAFATNVVLGNASAPLSVTLTNTGSAPVTVTRISVTDHFTVSGSCAILGPGSACVLAIRFVPTTLGSLRGELAIESNATNPLLTIALSGRAVIAPEPQATLSVAGLGFGNQFLVLPGPAQVVTLSNTGEGTLAIAEIFTTGDFRHTSRCGATLAAGASCQISVAMAATLVGARVGTLQVVSNAPGSPAIATLSGTGCIVSLARSRTGSVLLCAPGG